jgi:ankyrin repeat protein
MDQQDRDELREGRQKAYKAKKRVRDLEEKGYYNKGKYWSKGSQRSDVGKSAAGATELRSAAQLGDVEKVRRLVTEYGVSANAVAPDSKGETALHVAVKMANIEVVRFLVEQGGDPNHRDDGGHTPLETAEDCAFLKNEDGMKYAGAREQIMLLNGVTIWKACREGMFEQVKFMINKDPSLVNAGNHHGMTPLHFAVSSQNIPMAEFLLGKGAQASTRNENGTSSHRLAGEDQRQLERIRTADRAESEKAEMFRAFVTLDRTGRCGYCAKNELTVNKGPLARMRQAKGECACCGMTMGGHAEGDGDEDEDDEDGGGHELPEVLQPAKEKSYSINGVTLTQANAMSEMLAHADAHSGNGGALDGDSKAAAREVPYFTTRIVLYLLYPTPPYRPTGWSTCGGRGRTKRRARTARPGGCTGWRRSTREGPRARCCCRTRSGRSRRPAAAVVGAAAAVAVVVAVVVAVAVVAAVVAAVAVAGAHRRSRLAPPPSTRRWQAPSAARHPWRQAAAWRA